MTRGVDRPAGTQSLCGTIPAGPAVGMVTVRPLGVVHIPGDLTAYFDDQAHLADLAEASQRRGDQDGERSKMRVPAAIEP